jgi:hypothetical protein
MLLDFDIKKAITSILLWLFKIISFDITPKTLQSLLEIYL